jgi:hypothetical protein
MGTGGFFPGVEGGERGKADNSLATSAKVKIDLYGVVLVH